MLLNSGTTTVQHENDGRKTVEISATITGSGTWTHNIGTAACSLSLSLTSIARASQPSINTWPHNSPSFTIGDTIAIHMNRKSTAYTHAVVFNYGSSEVAVATGVADSCTYNTGNIAASLRTLCGTDADSYSGTITVRTYDGLALIGTATCNYTAVIPASSKPAVSVTSVTDQNSAAAALTGSAARMIKGYSAPRLVIGVTHPDSSTSLDRVVVKYGSSQITKTASGSPSTVTVDITGIQVASVTITAYDKRGRYTSIQQSWTLVNYVPVTAALNADRTAADLTKIGVAANGQCWKGSFGTVTNTVTVQYYYRIKNGSGSGTLCSVSSSPTIANNSSYSASATLAETFASSNEYDIWCVVTDALTTYTSAIVKVYQAQAVTRIYDDGFGITGSLFMRDPANPSADITLTPAQLQALKALLNVVHPVILHYSRTLTTPANDGADVSISFSSALASVDYHVSITREGNPNGFDQVSYVITNKTTSGFTVHSWNGYSSSVTQDLSICVIKP